MGGRGAVPGTSPALFPATIQMCRTRPDLTTCRCGRRKRKGRQTPCVGSVLPRCSLLLLERYLHVLAGGTEEEDEEYSRNVLSWSLHYAGCLLCCSSAVH